MDHTLTCYRKTCSKPAHPLCWNKGTRAYYCLPCARKIDEAGKSQDLELFPLLGKSLGTLGACAPIYYDHDAQATRSLLDQLREEAFDQKIIDPIYLMRAGAAVEKSWAKHAETMKEIFNKADVVLTINHDPADPDKFTIRELKKRDVEHSPRSRKEFAHYERGEDGNYVPADEEPEYDDSLGAGTPAGDEEKK